MTFNKNLTLIPLILTALNAEFQELNYTSDAGGNLLSVVPAYPSKAYTPTASITNTVKDAVVSLEVTTGDYANGVVPNYYEWDFDSDGEVDARTVKPTIGYSYPVAGSYTATLTLYDSLDKAREYTQSVTTTVDGTGEVIGADDGIISGSSTLLYGLNDISLSDETIVSKIKDAINELETIQGELGDLTSFDGDTLKQQYDGLKSRLDDAKAKMDAIKQSIDDNIADNDEKVRYKTEADKIKNAIEDIKTLVDGYKTNADNSSEAIDAIDGAIDGVIGMMRSSQDDESGVETTLISVKQGRNTISGNIDVTKLPPEIHSVWIVDRGNWYGYSPYSAVRDEINAKYLLIQDKVVNSKGMIVFAMADSEIESINSSSDKEHNYGIGYTLHGTNGESMNAGDIICDNDTAPVVVAKVRGDEPSVFVPNREIDGVDNFEYLDSDDGYFVLCDKDKR